MPFRRFIYISIFCDSIIRDYVEQFGYSVNEIFMGHGVGKDIHCPPLIPHHRTRNDFLLEEGMCVTIGTCYLPEIL